MAEVFIPHGRLLVSDRHLGFCEDLVDNINSSFDISAPSHVAVTLVRYGRS